MHKLLIFLSNLISHVAGVVSGVTAEITGEGTSRSFYEAERRTHENLVGD